jgi:DNA-binding beta-propeller fold protein YncE
MNWKIGYWKLVIMGCLAWTAWGGTFGKVVAVGGHAADLALDEARGVLYVANFTANRVDVVSLADGSVRTSINVAAFPGSLSLSPDGRYLVVTHFGSFQAPNTPANGLTVVDLSAGNAKQTSLWVPHRSEWHSGSTTGRWW